MTKQKTFKRRVRARMEKTGESYTAARRVLIAGGERPDTAPAGFEPTASEEAVLKATGRGWQEWFGLLDEQDATSKSHPEIVRWLGAEHDVPGWWCQAITVSFERARGLRALGQRSDGGWSATASKTVAVPVDRLFDAFEDEALRERWLPGAEMRRRSATRPRSARYDWEDGSTRLVAGFADMGQAKSQVGIEHERLPGAETAEEMKAWWRERLVVLKEVLEQEDGR